MKKRKDPVIDEIRAVRMKISAEFNHDINKLCEFIRQEEHKHPERLVQTARPSRARRKNTTAI